MANKTITMYGVKLKVGETLTAPNNESVLQYLKDAKKGKGLFKKLYGK